VQNGKSLFFSTVPNYLPKNANQAAQSGEAAQH
jgi:hypothetical protein